MSAAVIDRQFSPRLSVMDLFTIGIGPLSSHTVGPTRAAFDFARRALGQGNPTTVQCELFGSLALTGKGHGTDTAIMLGLSGWLPETIDPDCVTSLVNEIHASRRIGIGGHVSVPFIDREHLNFRMGEFLPGHPNALLFSACYSAGPSMEQTYFSIGGGAIIIEGNQPDVVNVVVKYPFTSGRELLAIGRETGLSIADIMWANEDAWRARGSTEAFIDSVRVCHARLY